MPLSLTIGGHFPALTVARMVMKLSLQIIACCLQTCSSRYTPCFVWQSLSDCAFLVLGNGSWKIYCKRDGYEAVMEATTDKQGTKLRAPTADQGLAPLCRDTFFGNVRLRVWRVDRSGVRSGTLLVDATSDTGRRVIKGAVVHGLGVVTRCLEV